MNADVRLTPEAITVKAFKKVRRGYRASEVDQFLQTVAQDVARLQEHLGRGTVPAEPLLTPQEVEQTTFNGSWRGYAMSQVDEFLDRIAGELDRLHQALAEAEQWRSADRAPLQPPLHTVLRSLPPPEPAARPLTAHDIAIKTFNRAPRGYRVEEVDQFLGAVAIELARAGGDPAAPSRVTAQEISGKRFTFGPRGYAMHEVDDFLARLVAQLAEHESGWSTTS